MKEAEDFYFFKCSKANIIQACVCLLFLSFFVSSACASIYSQSMNLKYERTTNDLEELKGKKGEEI